MSWARVQRFLGLVTITAGVLPAAVLAQTGATSGPASTLAKLAPPPPMPPPVKSPVSLFRELLAMTIQERQQFLTNRTPEARNSIERKIKEYEALTAEQRELRLRVTELRFFLLPLMANPSTNRLEQLASIPPEIRPLVQIRLERWDKLPPEKQKELLDNEAAIRSFLEFASITPLQQLKALTNMPPAKREELQERLRKWEQLSDPQRDEISKRFGEYFELRPPEQVRVLNMLSEEERRQIEKTLGTFKGFEPVKRAQLIRALNRFSHLSPSELQEFLRSAECWKSLSPDERKAWRSLVFNVSHEPPLPPGLRAPSLPPAPPPPLPPPPARSTPVATNG